MDSTHPPIPAIAVASASHIYIYKNLRPYFKFTLPTLDILPAEKEIWTQAAAETLEHNQVSPREGRKSRHIEINIERVRDHRDCVAPGVRDLV